MGFVSGRLADMTVITSDNPRFESPEAIMTDIETGVSRGRRRICKDMQPSGCYKIRSGDFGQG